MPTRRQFIANCSALAVTASVAPAAFGGVAQERMVPLDRISLTDFARQLNTVFSVSLANGSAQEVRLVEARPLDTPARRREDAEDAQNEKFALLFREPCGFPLVQETRLFRHPHLGSFALFIVPIGCSDRSHCYYEAIFNRPVSRAKAPHAGARSD